MTWSEIIAAVQAEARDATGVFHDAAAVGRYVEQAELFVDLQRILVEKTIALEFDGRPLYDTQSRYPDFIFPLRISINGLPIDPTTLATVSCLDPEWYITEGGEPETWFMAGATFLGFHPIPLSGEAQVTYLSSTAQSAASPTIASAWHQALVHYGNAIALIKEAQYPRASDHLDQFLQLVGIKRDARFLAEASQKPAKVRSEITWQAND